MPRKQWQGSSRYFVAWASRPWACGTPQASVVLGRHQHERSVSAPTRQRIAPLGLISAAPILVSTRAHGRDARATMVGPALFERLECRQMLAAHIVGDPTVYATIQAAVDAAAPGAVINIDAGAYS